MKNRSPSSDSQWLRIAELVRLSNTPRATIHFYLRAGLLHPPVKTGKTMAYYDATHLHKLTFIQQSRKRGIPLVGIRRELAAIEPRRLHALDPGQGEPVRRENETPEGRKLPRRGPGKQTREKLLETGSEMFRRNGYRNTKVSDITRKLDIGKGTFYFHFSDKKALFLECVPRIFEELFSKGWHRIRQIQDPQRRLELRAQLVFPVLDEFCTILRLCKEAQEHPDLKLKRLGEETYRSIRKPLENDIIRGIRQGLFQEVDPKVAATFLIGVMEGLHSLQTVDHEPPSTHAWESALKLILTGMKGPTNL
jgi:AcrR family transcriptional regulator